MMCCSSIHYGINELQTVTSILCGEFSSPTGTELVIRLKLQLSSQSSAWTLAIDDFCPSLVPHQPVLGIPVNLVHMYSVCLRAS